jgi:3-hydroxybutyryl-CoA dehydratase
MGRDYFEDYVVGETMVSPSRTITEADIVNFAMITGDWHPIHVDSEYAKKSVFGERIAHGMLTLSLGGSLCMWMGPNTFVPKSFIAFLGMETIRITVPTKIGDTLHWEGTVTVMEPKSKGRGIITYACEVKNQRDDVCASYIQNVLVGLSPVVDRSPDGVQGESEGRS